jgi:asparagine synthase (glutamine-hydrolysing)
MSDDEREWFARLDAGVDAALAPWRAVAGPVTVLFSGGVDSGLLAWELRDRPGLRLLAVGLPGSPDLRAARGSALALGRELTAVELEPEEVLRGFDRWAPGIRHVPWTRQTVLVALALGLAHSDPGPALCGQGIDELFLGYAHFRDLSASDAKARSARDWTTLTDVDGPLAIAIGRELDRELVAPYLGPAFVRAALEIPIERRLPGGEPKALFRRWARSRGLPAPVAERPKRAFQYGSGIARLLEAARPDARAAADAPPSGRITAIYPGPGSPV